MTTEKLSQCRLCADFIENMSVLNIKDSEFNLRNIIEEVFNINFSEESYSKVICLHCCAEIKSLIKFREKVRQAQEFLVPITLECELQDVKEESDGFEVEIENFGNQSAKSDFSSDDDYPLAQRAEILDENSAKNEPNIKEINNQKSTKNEANAPKRKYVRTGNSQKKKLLLLDPERAKLSQERAELIRRVNDEWKQYKWKCHLCEIEITTGVENLNEHYNKVHNEPPCYTCMECSKSFTSYSYFKRHVGAHRNKFKYKCDICIRFFSRSKDYRNHAETHSTEHKYMCPHCGKHYKAAMSFKAHLRKHKETANPKIVKFECELCHKKLKSKHSLYCHKKMHIGKRDYTCEQCGKTFLFLSGLKVHIQVRHSDLKPYACLVCQKMFKSRSLLSMHQQVHRTDRKYGCEVCGKRFHRGETLKRHSSVHTGVLAFPCESCSKRFRTNQQLKIHLRQHTGERPYSCDTCDHRFVDSSNYIKHMRAKHGLMSIRKNVQYKTEDHTYSQENELK